MKEYRYIRAWCKMLGSYSCFTENEVARAITERAPETAVYRKLDGTRITFEEIQSADTKRKIQGLVDKMDASRRITGREAGT